MADTFISELVGKMLSEYQGKLDRITVIFPNRRAGLFFRKALSRHIDQPIWMPQVTSMEDFVMQYSPYRKIETLEAVFALYEVYKKFQNKSETFDQFFFWGEMILRDFEEIDQYLVNTGHLFTSVKSQKELDEEFYFLDDEDKRIIQSFWSSFLPQTTKSQEAFLETWKILLPLYSDFREALQVRGEAYGGMIYRDVTERLHEIETDRVLWFAGFNALTFTEENIIRHFVGEHGAQIMWDLDDYYFSNPRQEAGFFLRTYAKDPVLGKTFPPELPRRLNDTKNFEAIGVSLEVGQTKALAEVLALHTRDVDFEPERAVVVLPHEYMLFPALHAIPEAIEKVNITMGYPLKDTPVYSLLESALALQNLRKESLLNGISFYYKPLIGLLEHPLLFSIEEEKIKALIADIKKRNRITLYLDDLEFTHPVFRLIFRKADHGLDYLLDILKGLYSTWKDKGHDLELEFISRFYEHILRIKTMMGERADTLGYEFLIRLFRRLARSLKIPFTGEPLSGLQIMGILETRNLDFEHVYILNMNEDSWPAPPRRGSFIPYNIRKAFDLPVFDHQDAIYAYLFYRLLQRAKKVFFFYNTVAEFNVNGELSRLVQQLEVESGYRINRRILANPITTTAPDPIIIQKDALIQQKMQRFVEGYAGRDASWFTPSALNTYLDCRLRFYFKYIEKLYEPEEVQEELDPMVFGNILHNSLETLYSRFIKREKRDVVHPGDFFWIREDISGVLNQTFIDHYGIKNTKKFVLEGRSLIAADVLKKFMEKILDYDSQYAPFRIIGLEASSRQGYSMEHPVELQGKKMNIRLKGVIDRIDLKQGKVRVIDYKTGRDEKDFTTLAALTDRDDSKRRKAVFQVFFYCYLFMKKYEGEYETIEPGLFNSRDLFMENFSWWIDQKEGRMSIPVREFQHFSQDFEKILTDLLTEMYDPEIPFDQTTDPKKCGFCAYKEICGRG